MTSMPRHEKSGSVTTQLYRKSGLIYDFLLGGASWPPPRLIGLSKVVGLKSLTCDVTPNENEAQNIVLNNTPTPPVHSISIGSTCASKSRPSFNNKSTPEAFQTDLKCRSDMLNDSEYVKCCFTVVFSAMVWDLHFQNPMEAPIIFDSCTYIYVLLNINKS